MVERKLIKFGMCVIPFVATQKTFIRSYYLPTIPITLMMEAVGKRLQTYTTLHGTTIQRQLSVYWSS